MSLGTSGTIYASSNKPLSNPPPGVANFCGSTGSWLPLICTMNATSTTSLIRKIFGDDLKTFEHKLQQSSSGAGGMTFVPFLNGERVPDLPNANGSILGITANNFTAENLVRAAVEGVTNSLRYGLDLLRDAGITTKEIRLTGGGANSASWRQLVADTMNAQVICPAEVESAAFGAAMQAAWSLSKIKHDAVSLFDLSDKWVTYKKLLEPDHENVLRQEESYRCYQNRLDRHYLFGS